MSRTQCRRTKTQHSQTVCALCCVLCYALVAARPTTKALLTVHPIWPQLYFRRRDEMY